MGMAPLCFLPADDLAYIFDDGVTLGYGLDGKHAFTMHTGAAGLNAALVGR
jgi:hypothetical protein